MTFLLHMFTFFMRMPQDVSLGQDNGFQNIGYYMTLPWCIPIIGLTSSYQIVRQNENHSLVYTIAYTLAFNTWTHIVTSYSTTNEIRLSLLIQKHFFNK